jgi:hypothetical protein
VWYRTGLETPAATSAGQLRSADEKFSLGWRRLLYIEDSGGCASHLWFFMDVDKCLMERASDSATSMT